MNCKKLWFKVQLRGLFEIQESHDHVNDVPNANDANKVLEEVLEETNIDKNG